MDLNQGAPPAQEPNAPQSPDNQQKAPQGQDQQPITDAQVLEFLSKATGRPISSIDEVVNQRPAYNFNSPLAEKLEELTAGGATPQEISTFVAVQQIDAATLPDVEAIVTAMQFENPKLTREDVRILAASKYNFDAEPGTADAVTLKAAAMAARDTIESKKVEAAKPASLEAAQAAKAQQEAFISRISTEWPTIVSRAEIEPPTVKVTLPLGEYEFAFTPSPEIIAAAKKDVAELLVSSGYDPSKVDPGAIKGYVQNRINQLTYDDRLAAAMKKVAADTEAAVRAQYAGPSPTPPKTATPSPAAVKQLIFTE